MGRKSSSESRTTSSFDSIEKKERKKKKRKEGKRKKRHLRKYSNGDSFESDSHRSNSSSNSSNSSYDKEKYKRKKKKKEREREREREKKKKEENKLQKHETLTVKELKKEREELMKKHFNYSDECNPFGDNTLSTPFVWKLKNKYEKLKNNNKIQITTNSLLDNAISKISEIEEVKKRREQREKEQSLLEDYKLQKEKEKNQINLQEYKEKEQHFFINQVLQASDKRIENNLMQPIDKIRIAYQLLNNEPVTIPPNFFDSISFYTIIKQLNKNELLNFHKQAKLFALHEKISNEESRHTFWDTILFFTQYYLDKMKNKNNIEMKGRGEEEDTHMNMKIKNFFENKNYDDLEQYEEKIQEIMKKNDERKKDFWESVLLQIPYFKAKLVLDNYFEKLYKKFTPNVLMSIHNQRNDNNEEKDYYRRSGEEDSKEDVIVKSRRQSEDRREKENTNKYETYNVIEVLQFDECKSPKVFPYESFKDGFVYSPKEEQEERLRDSKMCLEIIKKEEYGVDEWEEDDSSSLDEFSKFKGFEQFMEDQKIYKKFIRKERSREGVKNEIIMKDISYKNIPYTIKDSMMFVSRKPFYFNRIRTSFDWNKYNKSHYDYENTPPKYIAGYKFNIFYTNLLRKDDTPSWKLEPIKGEKEKILIVFKSGPPYLDIAFKIVNSEWCVDKNRGFRNVFDKGILQLCFNFKKKRYRR